MKVVEYDRYGPPEVLIPGDAEKPIPGEDEVLIRIRATTVTATECTFRQGKPFIARLFTGLFKPRIKRLGEELAGEVEAVGSRVNEFQVGDQIFGIAGQKFGAYAEYLCLPGNGVLALKPENLDFGEAAGSCDGFLTAMPFLRDVGKIQSGQRVLINGASGMVGSSAVQIAKYFDAEVTGVCSSENANLVKSLGADHVIDYHKEDFTKGEKKYDIIFDTVGKAKFSQSKRVLNAGGIFLEAAIDFSILPDVLLSSIFGNKKLKIAATGLRKPEEKLRDLQLLRDLLTKGRIKPVIDRTYELKDIVLAHRYVEKGHKKGNVIIHIP